MVEESINILNNLVGDSDLEEIGITCKGFISIEDSLDAEESAESLKEAGINFRQFDSRDASGRWLWLTLSGDEILTYTWDDLSIEAGNMVDSLLNTARWKEVYVVKNYVKEAIYNGNID